MEKTFKPLKRLILISILLIYLSFLTGSLGRISGPALGCPDWPKCWGNWRPPVSRQELLFILNDLDNTTFKFEKFNITFAWVDFFNRWLSVLIGFLLIITFLFSFRIFTAHKKIFIGIFFSLLLYCHGIILNGLFVIPELNPYQVSFLYLSAMTVSLLLINSFSRLRTINNKGINTNEIPVVQVQLFKKGLKIFIYLFIIQILTGTLLRQYIEYAFSGVKYFNSTHIHITWAILTFFHYYYYFHYFLPKKVGKNYSVNTYQLKTINSIGLLVFSQVLIGSFIMGIFSSVAVFRLLHHLLPTLIMGLCIYQYSILTTSNEN